MDISFELYKVFYHVAKHLNFSEAAQELFISQSAVSQSIKALEEKLNCQLFIRHTKQVRLTQEGETLFQHVEQAYHFIKTAERSIHEIHSLQQGEVKIGASDTICKYYLLPIIKEFHQTYPDIRIHITNRTSPVGIELLKKGLLDLAVVNMPEDLMDKSLEVTALADVSYQFVAGERFCHLMDKEVSLKELENYPLLMLEKNTTTRILFDQLIETNHVQIVPELELSSVDLLIELAKIGLGISFVMESALTDISMDKGLFTLHLKESIPHRKLGILTHRQIPTSTAAKKFIELLIERS
ncbi:MAG: LysR family transcriptional regulator [Thermotaleaceae bacterium]